VRVVPLNRAITLEEVTEAEKRVELGETLLAETRVRIYDRLRNGLDVREAHATLLLLEQTQALRVADFDRLRRELAELR
jgi:hypothetical protein